ncbi:hypothetical protein ILYODFUR_037806 [Ilyodon furcidens]|uniref:Uncharacterized protein n=1 Tax=Ilyodon furcidens TaxID=33524 RepID=A0ABV0U130_9TELE
MPLFHRLILGNTALPRSIQFHSTRYVTSHVSIDPLTAGAMADEAPPLAITVVQFNSVQFIYIAPIHNICRLRALHKSQELTFQLILTIEQFSQIQLFIQIG